MPKFLDNIEFYDNDGVLRKITDLEPSIKEAQTEALNEIDEAGTAWSETLGIDAFVNFRDSHNNIENGAGSGSLKQVSYSGDTENIKNPVASGMGSVAFGGFRGDKPNELPTEDDRTNVASGIQSAVFGCGNLAAGDWSFVSGKDNTVYSNRAFVSGGANVSQAVDSEGNVKAEKTNVGRFNAIFGNNNTFKSSNTAKESNLIAGGSNTVDTERSIVVGYSNNVSGYYNAVFGLENTVNADRSLIGGEKNTINGAYHLAAGSNNEGSGQFNITSGQDNNNAGWSSAAIGKGLVVGEGHTAQTVLGYYNDNKSNTVLEIGWGSKDAPKNVFEVYKDGTVKTEQGTLSTQEYVNETVAAPKTKLNIGRNNTDINAVDSLTVGTHSLNRGHHSAAIGYDDYLGYDCSGNATSKQPTGAVALNWSRANGDYSLSAGYDTEVNHSYSAALNNKTKTGASAQTVLGSYNIAKSTTAFEVGNGDATTPKNAFEILKTGGFNSYGTSKIEGGLLVADSSEFQNKLAVHGGILLWRETDNGSHTDTTLVGSDNFHITAQLPDTSGTLTTKQEVASTYIQKSKISFSNGVLTIDLS